MQKCTVIAITYYSNNDVITDIIMRKNRNNITAITGNSHVTTDVVCNNQVT